MLKPLTGVGADMKVTRPLRVSSSGDASNAGGRQLSQAEQKQLREENGGGRIGLRNLGDPGERFSRDNLTATTQLSFAASNIAKVSDIDGVAPAAGTLTLTALHVEGTVPEQQQGQGGQVGPPSGPSGSGKTTLLQLLGALDRPSSGAIRFEGRSLDEMGDNELADLRRGRLGFVFQQFNLIPTLTAAQNIEAALAPDGMKRADRRARAAELLGRVGLAGRVDHLPSQLSGGEQQRVAIARSLANEPDVLLADEPTGNLDTTTGEEIMGVLRTLSEEGLSVVITHDTSIAAAAPRLVRMRDGRIALGPAPASEARVDREPGAALGGRS